MKQYRITRNRGTEEYRVEYRIVWPWYSFRPTGSWRPASNFPWGTLEYAKDEVQYCIESDISETWDPV